MFVLTSMLYVCVCCLCVCSRLCVSVFTCVCEENRQEKKNIKIPKIFKVSSPPNCYNLQHTRTYRLISASRSSSPPPRYTQPIRDPILIANGRAADERIATMGNAGSNAIPRERHKSSDIMLPSASPLKDGQPFIFEKKPILFPAESHDTEEEPYYTKTVSGGPPNATDPAATGAQHTQQQPDDLTSLLGDGSVPAPGEEPLDPDQPPALPTVFKWDGGGKQVYISGTFSEWKSLPMVRSHGDFVTIIDLPEGDHQYKFCVDGEWRHDPKLVNGNGVVCVCVVYG